MDVSCAGSAMIVGLTCASVACSGGKAKAVEDARRPALADDAPAPVPPTPTGPYRTDPSAKTGDVQIRVEWRDTPPKLRAAGAATGCGRPGVPALAPTTTWGIPEAFVAIEVDHGKPFEPMRPRVVLDTCALVPRVAIGADTLAIASAVERPAIVQIAEVGRLPFGSPAKAAAPRALYLPIVGHELETPLSPGAIYTVTFAGGDSATIVGATTPYVAITEPTGQVILRDVPVGTHAVRAWLPARGTLEPRVVAGSVTVTAGALAEVKLDIGVP